MLQSRLLAAVLVTAVTACTPALGDSEPGGTTIADNPEVETGMEYELQPCSDDEDCAVGGPACSEMLGICEVPGSGGRGIDCGGAGRGEYVDGACVCSEGFSDAFVPEFCCRLDGPDEICGGYEPQPGDAGGLCLAPGGTCRHPSLTCRAERNYCRHPEQPCFGFTCGGGDRGVCSASDGEPQCTCSPGFENETFELYCCPVDGSDPLCG